MAAMNELVTHCSDECTALQTAAGGMLCIVDDAKNALNTFAEHATEFFDNMHEVGPSRFFTLLETILEVAIYSSQICTYYFCC